MYVYFNLGLICKTGIMTGMFSLPIQEGNVGLSNLRSLHDRNGDLSQQQQERESFLVPSLLPTSATRDPVLSTAAITSRTGDQDSDCSLNNSILTAPSGNSPLPAAWHTQEPQQFHKDTPRRVSS